MMKVDMSLLENSSWLYGSDQTNSCQQILKNNFYYSWLIGNIGVGNWS